MNEHLKHMDVGSRNDRLCKTLQGMGLFVLPVFAEGDPSRIDHMLVSVELPARIKQPAEDTARAAVTSPVTSPEVPMHVQSSESQRVGVIDFPAVFRKRAVVVPANHFTIAIDPVEGVTGDFEGA